MKKQHSIFLALFMSMLFYGQVSLGDGTLVGSNGPIYPNYSYSYYQTLYKSAEINANGTITGLSYEMANDNPISNSDDHVDVWIGHTSKNAFTSQSDWIPTSSMTHVLTDGTITKSGTTVTITFDIPFVYNGNDNLVIAVDANENGYDGSGNTFYYSYNMNEQEKLTLLKRHDDNNPDPTSIESLNSGNAYMTHAFANVTLIGITQSCPKPTNLTISEITSNSAHLEWSQSGDSSNWTVEYGPNGFSLGEGTRVSVTDTNYTFENLSSSTNYDVYVISNCGLNDNSTWSNLANFSTLCGAISSDYAATFTDVPSCWREGRAELNSPVNFTVDSGWKDNRYFEDNDGNVIASNVVNIYSDEQNEWLVSPFVDLDAKDFILKTLVAVTAYSYTGLTTASAPMGSDDQVQLLMSLDNGTTWTNLKTWNKTNQPSANGESFQVDLSSYSGIAQFAFFGTGGNIDDDSEYDYDFHVGKFELKTSNLAVSDVTSSKKTIEYYPNPVNDFLYIKGENQVKEIKIINSIGNIVYKNTFDSTFAKIDMRNFPKGIYFVQADVDGTMQNIKIIKN